MKRCQAQSVQSQLPPMAKIPAKFTGTCCASLAVTPQPAQSTFVPVRPRLANSSPIPMCTLKSGKTAYSWKTWQLTREGTRPVVAALQPNQNSPLPNLLVIDTGLMLTNPGGAILSGAVAADGGNLEGLTIASVVTTPPPTAPVVTGVSGNVTVKATTIDVFGSNFLPGAWVRIGSMAPLPATVLSSTDLEVTIPEHAPAGANLDVIVTNPNLKSPPASQNQSGLLAGGITISPTSAFQPNNSSPRPWTAVPRFTTSIRNRWSASRRRLRFITRSCLMPMATGSTVSVTVLVYSGSSSPEALDWKLADDLLRGDRSSAQRHQLFESSNTLQLAVKSPSTGWFDLFMRRESFHIRHP